MPKFFYCRALPANIQRKIVIGIDAASILVRTVSHFKTKVDVTVIHVDCQIVIIAVVNSSSVGVVPLGGIGGTIIGGDYSLSRLIDDGDSCRFGGVTYRPPP